MMAMLVLAAALIGCRHSVEYVDFNSQSIAREGSFRLAMDPDCAFPLFTVPGETLWVAGWEPHILCGDGYEEGTVWVTTGHGHTTYWYVSEFDLARNLAQYVRVTPDADVGTVDIQVRSDGNAGAIVKVTYRLTGLSEAGIESLRAHFTEEAYEKMMAQWRSAIVENRPGIEQNFDT